MDQIVVEPQVTTVEPSTVHETVAVQPAQTTVAVTDDAISLDIEAQPVTLAVDPQEISLTIEPQTVTLTPSTGNTYITEGGGGGEIAHWFNGFASTITLGQVVYLSGDGIVTLAKADSAATADAVGVVAQATIVNSSQGAVQTAGVLGGMSGILFNRTYYLSDATAGLLTTSIPTSTGHYVVEVGVGVSTTELLIRPRLLVAL